MWSVLDKEDNETVIAVMPPDAPQYELERMEKEGFTLIEMTLENSPGYIGGKYIEGKFYPKEGMEIQ